MTRQEAIVHVCRTVALAYRTLDDYTRPSDGICEECATKAARWDGFKNDGHILEYVRVAVIEKLVREGHGMKMAEIASRVLDL